jgi:RNA polymerase sigma factor (sigma-70 family)
VPGPKTPFITDDLLSGSRGLIAHFIRAIDWTNGVPANGETDDIVQDVLQRAVRHRTAFIGTSEGEYCNWLFAIAQSVMLDRARRRGAAKRSATIVSIPNIVDSGGNVCELEFADSACSTPSVKIQRREQIENLFRALELLPDDQRLVVTGRYLSGLTLQEITDDLNERNPHRAPRTTKATASLLERGLRRLHKEVNRQE